MSIRKPETHVGRIVAAIGAIGICLAALSCSASDGAATSPDDDGEGTTVDGAGGGVAASAAGGGIAVGGAGNGTASSGGSSSSAPDGGATGGAGGAPTLPGAGGASAGGAVGVDPSAITLDAVGANGTIGLEWPEVARATAYRIYWSTTPGVTPATGQPIDVTTPDFVHRGVTNGTTYYYVVVAVTPQGDGPPSTVATATPGGEWALERLGTGVFDDVVTGAPVARVPFQKRLHVFLFAEGYTAADLPVFHDESRHSGDRLDDVDRWTDLVFGIEPYATFREAFVVWYLPRASNAQIGGDTAFAVPIDFSSGSAMMGQVPTDGDTAIRAWQALASAPYPPELFYSGNSGRARNDVAAFLIFDPARGRASVSGRTTSLVNPADGGQRIGAAFGVGHAHEFTHAFSLLRDEYIETTNTAPTRWDGTSNVVGTNTCSELPWAHLLVGGAINPDVDGLVGAFGEASVGYHSELLCLLNGTHDNATHYGGDGLLRVEDRMCNFCRETTAFRIFERSSVLADEATSFASWSASYRTPFYDRYGFQVPSVVPQTNDARNPGQGTAYFDACVP